MGVLKLQPDALVQSAALAASTNRGNQMIKRRENSGPNGDGYNGKHHRTSISLVTAIHATVPDQSFSPKTSIPSHVPVPMFRPHIPLRTNVLVEAGAVMSAILTALTARAADSSFGIAGQVVLGIGFLGTGASQPHGNEMHLHPRRSVEARGARFRVAFHLLSVLIVGCVRRAQNPGSDPPRYESAPLGASEWPLWRSIPCRCPVPWPLPV